MPKLDFIIEAELALVGPELQELSDPMLGVKDGRIVLIRPRDGQEPQAGVKVFRFPGCTVMPACGTCTSTYSEDTWPEAREPRFEAAPRR